MFENTISIKLTAVSLILLQTLWWWLTLKRKQPNNDLNNSSWVLYASQSGHAQSLAQQTADRLSQDDKAWLAISLDDWQAQQDLSALNRQRVLFVVSTQGEGDPPDNAVTFFHRLQSWQGDLSQLSFAILGLGDSRYLHFCGFAHRLYQRLITLSAQLLFDTVTLDNLNADDVKLWQHYLAAHFGGNSHSSPFTTVTDSFVKTTATLTKRHCENTHSPAPSLFSLQFTLAQELVWQAGDIAEVMIPTPNGELIRHYTIANIPTTVKHATDHNQLSLLVRQVQKTNGEPGAGSTYLTQTLTLGQSITINAIGHNPKFHLPQSPVPLLFIATGSGLAGILALLQQVERDWSRHETHHLIYGERYPDTDTPCRSRLHHYQKTGLLSQIDFCFSHGRTQDAVRYQYVQQALTAQIDQFSKMIEQGAMIYVCGSKSGLGKSIPETLKQCLSEKNYQQLIDQQRLRLDVY